MGSDTPVVEIPQWVSPPGGAEDGGHGTQTLMGWDVVVPTYWVGAGNIGTGGDRGIYQPSPENGHAIHCNLSYHVLVSGGGAESSNALIQLMVGAARSGYPWDNSGACSREGGGGHKNRRQREI